MVTNVLLDNIAGLGTLCPFGPGLFQTTFSSCAVSPNGTVAYFGRTASHDPEMRNLVVASLDTSGNVIGIPKCYPSSDRPLAPIKGYLGTDNHTTVTSIVVNSAKRRLYTGESRADVPLTTPGLNVYTLDTHGNPSGPVRTYADGNIPGNGTIEGLLMHPKLPLLYMVGYGMTGGGAGARQ